MQNHVIFILDFISPPLIVRSHPISCQFTLIQFPLISLPFVVSNIRHWLCVYFLLDRALDECFTQFLIAFESSQFPIIMMRTNNEDTIVEYLRRAQKHLICTRTHKYSGYVYYTYIVPVYPQKRLDYNLLCLWCHRCDEPGRWRPSNNMYSLYIVKKAFKLIRWHVGK